MNFAYESFIELKEKQLKKNQENYNKYIYALGLRTEAAEHIGIENIKQSRLKKLEAERAKIDADFEDGKRIFPEFRLMMLATLEA